MTEDALWLYGSVARGSQVETSDLDVLWITDADDGGAPDTRRLVNLPQYEHLAVRRYSWFEVSSMASYGSLFLLHVATEGRPMANGHGSSRFNEILRSLPPYTRSKQDIAGFAVALSDSESAIDDGGDPAFELGIIATVIRHASILATHLLGSVIFEREQSITRAFLGLGMHADVAASAVSLYEFRLAEARGIPLHREATGYLARESIAVATELIHRMEALHAGS